ncbi:MAG: lipopolysaccharide biosynthesis protein [Candidatus Sulfotelmatobacter sp.]
MTEPASGVSQKNADPPGSIPRSHRTLTHKTASGVAWISLFQIARQLLQVASVSVLARRVPPSAYGLMAMAVLIINFLETVRDAGTGAALVREREVSDDLAATVFWLTCGLGLGITLIMILVSWPAARLFHEPMVATVLQFLSIGFFVGSIGIVPLAMLNREMAFRKVALAQTAGAVSGTVVAITVALAGGKVWSLVSGSIVISTITPLAIWIVSPFRLKAVFRFSDARHMASFGLNLSGFNVLNYFSRNADNLLVGKFLGSAPLGFYQMGYMLMTYPIQNFAAVIAQVVYPALSKMQDDHERFRVAYLRTCRLIGLLIFPLMLGLAVTAQPFIRVILGPRWMPVAGLLLVFAPLGAAQSIYTTVGLIYNTQGRSDLQFRWAMFASAMYVASFAVGLRWGIQGVASCYALVWLLLMVPSFMIPFRLVELSGKHFLRTLWPTMWMSLAMAAVTEAWLQGLRRLGILNAPVELISTVIVGIVFYLVLVLTWRPPVLSELAVILNGSSRPVLQKIARYLPSYFPSQE